MAIIMEEKRCISSVKCEPVEVITIEDISSDSYSELVEVKQERTSVSLSTIKSKTKDVDLKESDLLVISLKEEEDDELPNTTLIKVEYNIQDDQNVDLKCKSEEFIIKDEVSSEGIEFTIKKKADREENHQNNFSTMHKCRFCNYKTKSKEKVGGHTVFHTGETPFTCHTYDRTTNLQSDFERHALTHSENIECSVLSSMHEDANVDVVLYTREKPAQCDEEVDNDDVVLCTREKSLKCDDEIKASQNLYPPRPFRCGKCKFATESKRRLKSHKLTHAPKLFQCYTCGHKTCTKGNLRRHVLVHFKCRVKRYSCPACKSRFLHERSLTTHMSVRPCKP